jgi:hypothetical protein
LRFLTRLKTAIALPQGDRTFSLINQEDSDRRLIQHKKSDRRYKHYKKRSQFNSTHKKAIALFEISLSTYFQNSLKF